MPGYFDTKNYFSILEKYNNKIPLSAQILVHNTNKQSSTNNYMEQVRRPCTEHPQFDRENNILIEKNIYRNAICKYCVYLFRYLVQMVQVSY